MRTHRIAAMGGDGIGPEVVAAGVQALKACAERDGQVQAGISRFRLGSDYYKKHGVMMPADGADQLRKFDAILFGSVGAPDIPDHITLWGLRLAICQPLDSMPTFVRPGFCRASPARCVMSPVRNWTGSSCARTPKVNIPAWAAACTGACRKRWPPTFRS